MQCCERTLDPVCGNRMAPTIICSTESCPSIAIVGEGSIKTCLILGIGGAEARVVIVLLKPLFWRSSGTDDCHCYLFVPSASLFHLFISPLQFSNLVLMFYFSILEYPSNQWFWKSSSVSYLPVLNSPTPQDSMVKGSRVVCYRTSLNLYYALVTSKRGRYWILCFIQTHLTTEFFLRSSLRFYRILKTADWIWG